MWCRSRRCIWRAWRRGGLRGAEVGGRGAGLLAGPGAARVGWGFFLCWGGWCGGFWGFIGWWWGAYRRNLARRELAGIFAGAGRDDERVWDVQCAGDELFAAAVGDGTGWDAAQGVWQDAFEDAGAIGRDCSAGDWMGALLGIGIRAPCYAGHYFVWGQLDFGVCDASRAAHSRARVETGVSRAGRISGRDFGGRVPVVAARIGGGARRE